MLRSIHIQNFALAKNLEIEFQDGLNIITGETGTGKSILVGAISAVLGGRIYTEVVRTGAEKAVVEAVFDTERLPPVKNLLEEKGLESNSELILRREISIKGSSRAFINDIPITITTLSEIGDMLVDIHGQNEHQSLLRRETQRYFLDAFGELESSLRQVDEDFRRLAEAQNHLHDLEKQKLSMDEKYELYQFQLDEINKTNLQSGEDQQLQQERKILSNSEKIFHLSSQFNQIFEGPKEGNLRDLVSQALHTLKELSDFSEDIKGITEEFSSAKIILEEASRSVEEFQSKIEYDPTRLEEIEQRLATISVLKKKYGDRIEDILEYRNKLQTMLDLRENIDLEMEKALKEVESKTDKYKDSALRLSDQRKKVAESLQEQVITHLKEIGMPKIRFVVKIEWLENPDGLLEIEGIKYHGDKLGLDQIEFFISPNPGEEFKPLAKIASGGEISRIMLSLKNILAEIDQIPLLIFDEIDSGVSGKIALAVGKSIQRLSQSHQIICITHLPQIASYGISHYRVEKYVDNGRTFTQVLQLSGEKRVKEIASLMGGKLLSDEILQSARQLLKEAGETAATE